MNAELRFTRYAAVFFSTLLTIFYLPADSEAAFLFWTLSFLAAISFLDKLATAGSPIAHVFELMYISILTFSYGGSLYLLFLSFLIKWNSAEKPEIHFAAAGLAAMNLSLGTEDMNHLFLANLLYFLFYTVLKQSRIAIHTKDETETLYDQLRKKHHQLEDARQRLIVFARQVEQSAQLEERNRIAADIHDDLGHQLTRVKFMLDAALSIEKINPEKSSSMMLQIQDQLASSLESLRSTVHNMKPAGNPGSLDALKKFLDDAERQAGIAITFSMAGSSYDLSPRQELILFRNTQEALTNALRHGKASKIWVELEYKPYQISLLVKNDGLMPDKVQMGFGMKGMEERAEMAGGKFAASVDGLFSVCTTLPRINESSEMNE